MNEETVTMTAFSNNSNGGWSSNIDCHSNQDFGLHENQDYHSNEDPEKPYSDPPEVSKCKGSIVNDFIDVFTKLSFTNIGNSKKDIYPATVTEIADTHHADCHLKYLH